MSISSIIWRDEVKYIEKEKIQIIFKTEDKRLIARTYNLRKLDFEE